MFWIILFIVYFIFSVLLSLVQGVRGMKSLILVGLFSSSLGMGAAYWYVSIH